MGLTFLSAPWAEGTHTLTVPISVLPEAPAPLYTLRATRGLQHSENNVLQSLELTGFTGATSARVWELSRSSSSFRRGTRALHTVITLPKACYSISG